MSKTYEEKWRVKITGLPKNVSALNLSKQLRINIRRICIPGTQDKQSSWYAWVHDFGNETQAKAFTTQWDQKELYPNYRIRCKASKKLRKPLNQASNVTRTYSSNISHQTTLTQDQEIDDSSSQQETSSDESGK